MPFTHPTFWLLPLIIGSLLALFSTAVWRSRLRGVYRAHFSSEPRERLFLASVGFFVAVLVVRGITVAIHNGVGPFHDVSVHGRHIHHLVWGILLLLTVGYTWLIEVDRVHWVGRLTAMLYGVAAALTLDEFALWLNLSDVYWERQGRESFEAMGLFGGLLAIGLIGGPFFSGAIKEIGRLFTRT